MNISESEIRQSGRIMFRIFSYCNLATLVRMRLLSKGYRRFIDKHLAVKDLAVHSEFNFNNRWNFNHELVVYKRSVVQTLNLPSHSPFLSNLRRLKITYLTHNDLIRLEMYQSSLIHLEIETLELYTDHEPIHLHYLQFFSILDVVNPPRQALPINSPHLQALKFAFSFPFRQDNDVITKLDLQDCSEVNYLEFSRGHVQSYQYQNLRRLIVNEILNVSLDTLLMFATLPHLTQLDCNICEPLVAFASTPDPKQIVELEVVFDFLVNQIKVVNPNLEIRIQNVLLVPDKPFNDYRFDLTLVGLHDTNFGLLSTVSSVSSIDYGNMIETLTNASPLQIVERYVNIQKIYIMNPRNPPCPAQFIAFLARCKGIHVLYFDYAGFTEEVYRQLFSLPSLFSLHSFRCFEREEVNLSFAFDLEYIRCFWTNMLRKEKVLALMSRLKCPITCEFLFSMPGNPVHHALRLDMDEPDDYTVTFYEMNNSVVPATKMTMGSFQNMSLAEIKLEIMDDPNYDVYFKH